jgi:plastocyanin
VRRRRLLRTLPVAASAGLAGCLGGDGDDGGDEDTPTATPESTDTASPSPTPTASPSPTPEPTDPPTATATPTTTATPTATATSTPVADLTVTVGPEGRLVFDPETFEVAAGATVRWEWASAGHNVSPGSLPTEADWPGDDESTYGTGHTYAYTFGTPGRYEYHCDPHQSVGMTGSFTVR